MENPEHDSKTSAIIGLIELIETLRGINGCPWDRRQTPRSMMVYLIEEMYELAEAIETDTCDEICEELGDVLFHVFFMARMFQEMGYFSIQDVAHTITAKMIRRHPHVFGNERVDGTEDVIQNWQKIKLSEKRHEVGGSTLDSVPVKLPALIRAYSVLDRVARTGFDDKDISRQIQRTSQSLTELETALSDRHADRIDEAVGNSIFALVNLARKARVHPETALAGSVRRFIQRFKLVEKIVLESGRELESLSDQEKNGIWQKTKPMPE